MPEQNDSSEIVISLVSGEDRDDLSSVYAELGSDIPPDGQANVVVATQDGELMAAVTSEVLLRCDQWWISPPYRNTSKASVLIRKLARYLLQSIPPNASVIIFAADDNQGRLFKKLGFREIENVRVYRLDR